MFHDAWNNEGAILISSRQLRSILGPKMGWYYASRRARTFEAIVNYCAQNRFVQRPQGHISVPRQTTPLVVPRVTWAHTHEPGLFVHTEPSLSKN